MRLVIDTNIIIAFVNQEKDKDLEALERFFNSVKSRTSKAYISAITISEIFGIFCKEGDAKKAVEIIVYLKSIGIEIVPVNEEIAKNGGVLKGKYSISSKSFSYGDAIVMSTAMYLKSDAIITYDPEFSGITSIPALKPENL